MIFCLPLRHMFRWRIASNSARDWASLSLYGSYLISACLYTYQEKRLLLRLYVYLNTFLLHKHMWWVPIVGRARNIRIFYTFMVVFTVYAKITKHAELFVYVVKSKGK